MNVNLTINAFKVEEVGSGVHLVKLQTHFDQVSSHWVFPPHSQMKGIHHLETTQNKKRPTMK